MVLISKNAALFFLASIVSLTSAAESSLRVSHTRSVHLNISLVQRR